MIVTTTSRTTQVPEPNLVRQKITDQASALTSTDLPLALFVTPAPQAADSAPTLGRKRMTEQPTEMRQAKAAKRARTAAAAPERIINAGERANIRTEGQGVDQFAQSRDQKPGNWK